MAGERAEVLAALRDRVARLQRGERDALTSTGQKAAHLPFGVMPLDACLPGGGLRLGALHEVAPMGPDLPDAAARTLLAAGVLARLPGPVLWCLSARDLFAPGLARAGLHPDRVIYVETHRDAEVLLLVEEGARFAGLAAVVGEVARAGLTVTRRLQLAAEASGVTVLLLRRRGRDPTAAETASAAATRWQIAAHPSEPLSTPGLGRARWRVALTRCRGAPAGTDAHARVVGACEEAGRLALPTDLADRQDPQARPRRAAAQ